MTKLFLSASLLALALASPAFAQTSPASAADTNTAQSGPTVVVTAPTLEDTVPQELAKTGVRVDIVTDQAIRNGGYVDVSQSLQQLAPGLSILPKNGPFDYVNISLQGSRTEDVLWLVDGVRINNRLYASTPPLDTLPSAMVDHIDVLEGGQALFYGTSAVAGAVDIVTRPFTNSLSGQVSLAGDTNSERHIDAYVSDGFGIDKFVVYGSADKSEGYLAFRPQDYQPSSTHRHRGYSVYTLGFKNQLDITSQLRFTASYQHTWADLDYALPFRVAKDVNKRNEDIATAKLDYQPNERVSLYLKTYYHNWHTDYDTFYNSTMSPGTIDVIYDNAFWGYWDYGANALGKFQLARGVEGFLGYDFQSYGGRDEVLVIEQHNEQTHAVFGQIHLTPDLIPNTDLAAGFRYNMPSVGQSDLIWNASGKYEFSKDLFVKGEVGTNFRLPTAEELYANDPLEGERGNPNLRPETSTSVNLSVGGRPTVLGMPLHWELIGFNRDINNLIDFASFDPVTGEGIFGNIPGTVHERGGEAVLDAELRPWLSLSLNYTYTSSDEDGGPIPEVPHDLFKAGLDYHPADKPYGATLTVTHTGATYVTIAGTQLQYGNYTVVDLSGRYFLDAGRHHELSLSIQNLFDAQYGLPGRGCADTPADGPYDCSLPYFYVNRGLPRTFRGSYTYRF